MKFKTIFLLLFIITFIVGCGNNEYEYVGQIKAFKIKTTGAISYDLATIHLFNGQIFNINRPHSGIYTKGYLYRHKKSSTYKIFNYKQKKIIY